MSVIVLQQKDFAHRFVFGNLLNRDGYQLRYLSKSPQLNNPVYYYQQLEEFYSKYPPYESNCTVGLSQQWLKLINQNSTLSSLLKRYQTFVSLHIEDLSNGYKLSKNSQKIIVTYAVGGLNNFLLSSLSTIFLGMMTKRVVINVYPRDMNLLICPDSLLGMTTRQDLPGINHVPNYQTVIDYMYTETDSVSVQYWDNPSVLGFFGTKNGMNLFEDVKIWRLDSCVYFLPIIMIHPYYGQIIELISPELNIFRPLFQASIVPTQLVWNKALYIQSKVSSQGNFTIGIQARMFGGYYDQFKERTQMLLQSITQYLKNVQDRQFSILCISLSNQACQDIKVEAEKQLGQNVSIYQPSAFQQQQNSDEEVIDAFSETLALSMVNFLAISDTSTFGYMALGLYDNKNLIYFRASDREQMNNTDYVHFVDSFQEPCQHEPIPSFIEDNLKISLERYNLTRCIDWPQHGFTFKL